MSRLPFELLLALRYVRPKRTFVSVITLISVIGVMLGVAVLIIVISVMTGFDEQLREKLVGFNAHLRVTRSDDTMHDYAGLLKTISAVPGVRGVAPYVLGPVLVETEPDNNVNPQVHAPLLRGIDPRLENKISSLPTSIKYGAFDVSRNGVLIGSQFARMLGLRVGDRVNIYSARIFRKMKESHAKGEQELALPDEYTVRGIFEVGFWEYDYGFIIASLGDAQDMYELGEDVHGLLVMLDDPYKATEIGLKLLTQLGGHYRVTTWEDENRHLLDALVVEKKMMFYISFFVVIVAAFGITSVLITFVVQKTREIGMLKALGATSGQVMWLFLTQSFVVGILGVCSGLGLGVLAVSWRNEFLEFMRRLTQMDLFPPDIYVFNQLPAHIKFGDVAIICGGSLVICVLAGLFPAWNAGRLRPVDALRHE